MAECNVASFLRVAQAAKPVSHLRRLAWRRIQEHLGWRKPDEDSLLLDTVRRVCVLASSSRGGTSVTAEFLQWQGADCDLPAGRMLTLPGEEKPHLILSGLAFPTREQRFDNLEASDTHEPCLTRLLAEMTSEVGYPVVYCTDLELYSIQLYRRLLLQWPLHMIALEQRVAIRALADALRGAFGGRYCDSASSRTRVLECCTECFPFIRTSFYDCSPVKRIGDSRALEHGAWSLEEPPFVLPPPWHNATAEELADGTLLLRDPSNAWRLGFWKAVFSIQEVLILHLMRDVRESIQGLCDGWNYPFGFQTLATDVPLCIAGYTDEPIGGDANWKQYRLNFSVDRRLSRQLLEERRPMTLVEVCGRQWREAHEQILADAAELSLSRIALQFSALRKNPIGVFNRTCTMLGLEVSRSGIAYAESFPSRWVMATVIGPEASHGRWRHSPHATEIRKIADRREFVEVTRRLMSSSISTSAVEDAFSVHLTTRSSGPVQVCASA